ncbi:hypothetical protein, conserved [Eimeria maxima]|uniref:PITH domain-containing protein n=1 Tax=Eimeria maxima TaxID=5804 RepID=U6M7L0_EIMMA|nr:hypothetical protein, conserved [Eimeria maxima]CDJ60202.1 hypothetical protein, conserved [Eimeria maxima]
MGLPQPQDRLGQTDLTEIHEVLDISGSIALNARQPPAAHVASTSAAPPPDAGGPVGAAQLDAAKSQGEHKTSTSVDANTQEQTTAAAETASETQKTGTQATSGTEANEKGCTAQQPDGNTPSAAAAAAAPGSEIGTLQQILRTKEFNLALVSDVDEQLLVNISFKQPVRLASFAIFATTPPKGFNTNPDEEDSVSEPMVVKVYCNKQHLNFCGVVDEACAFSVLLKKEDVLAGRRIALPGSKFHMCSSAQFFIQENQTGSAYTFLNRLIFYGVANKRYS